MILTENTETVVVVETETENMTKNVKWTLAISIINQILCHSTVMATTQTVAMKQRLSVVSMPDTHQ
jgi:hypothetical protein